ncbi:MAG: hypothetical protein B6D61_08735 [Bacteroidetes bacterium 4484_249]|nr:MAG: hypothetical protein B6D61_08735 [Bacteroidetes bacterium 4484_249]
MKRIILTYLLAFAAAFSIDAQDSITLDMCYQKATENYPVFRQKELLSASNDLEIKNLNKNYLPKMVINGQAHYQSDVTKTPFQDVTFPGLPVIPTVEKDWYKITLDVNEVIYDGSATARQKKLEVIDLAIEQQNVDVELYKLKESINRVFFNILLLRENKKILRLHKANLDAKLKTVESGVKNGTILESNADILKAEIIKIKQSISEIEIGLNASFKIMNEYTGLNLNKKTDFVVPDVFIDLNKYNNNRLEYSLLSLQQNKIEASKKLLGSKNLPQFSAFGQAGYGRPGYDMLKNEFDDFYMIGLRLHWNFYDWNHSKKEKEILDLRNEIINTKKETFDKNLRISLENKIAELKKIEEIIISDEEIIVLRTKISKSVSSQLDNGVITSTEYLTEINAEAKAKLDMEIHKIQLIKAKLDYQAALGDL